MATATAAAATSVRRARKLRLTKRVANTSHGVDEPRLTLCLQLPAQVGDVDLERVGAGPEVVAPHLLEDARARDHHARVVHEQLQEPELGSRQLQLPPGAVDLNRLQVENDVRELEDALLGGRHRAAQQRPEPGKQLVEREWLDQ